MIQIALIQRNGSNVGIVGHDTSSGRVVYKFEPSSKVCEDLLDVWTNRSIINESKEDDFVIRSRVTPSEEEYLSKLLFKTINPPYRVKYIEQTKQGAVSNVVLKEFEELV